MILFQNLDKSILPYAVISSKRLLINSLWYKLLFNAKSMLQTSVSIIALKNLEPRAKVHYESRLIRRKKSNQANFIIVLKKLLSGWGMDCVLPA